jgi:hypothetical protein
MRHGETVRRRLTVVLLLAGLAACRPPAPPVSPAGGAPVFERPVPPLVADLEERTFLYFWDLAHPETGLVPDRWPTPSFSSVAAVGFGLTAYGIGAERGWVSREAARDRTLGTLRFLAAAPRGPEPAGTIGHRGFFYHFLHMDSGFRFERVELSSIDTALLIAGVLFSQSYFDRDDPAEKEIRSLAEALYRAVEWPWMVVRPPAVAMGWTPEGGFLGWDWRGYNEAMILLILALGSPTHPIAPEAWDAWTRDYVWGEFHGQEHISFPPLFGHQYTAVWVDFRGIQDDYTRTEGLDYHENSRRATYSHRAYAIANPEGWRGYGADLWGLTASDGPFDGTLEIDGRSRTFHTYWARGVGLVEHCDDGTIAPTAAASSIAFAPEIAIPAIAAQKAYGGDRLYGRYGFFDAFNPTLRMPVKLQHGQLDPELGWFDTDYLGIDQGPIVALIENHRSELVWRTMKRNPHLVRGLRRAGFRGGWLDTVPEAAR